MGDLLQTYESTLQVLRSTNLASGKLKPPQDDKRFVNKNRQLRLMSVVAG
jgi:hypothetical protein